MIFYDILYSRNAMKTMRVHFVSNTIRTIVNYSNYAVSYTFPCKFVLYFRCYMFFVVSCWIRMYVGVLCKGDIGVKVVRNMFMDKLVIKFQCM